MRFLKVFSHRHVLNFSFLIRSPANQSLSLQNSRTIRSNAHDWNESLRVVQCADSGDET